MQIPAVPKPLWGVNWSESNRLLVLCGGGLLELTLAPVVAIRTLAAVEDLRQVFDPDRDCALVWENRNYLIDGPNGCGPGKVDHPNGDRLGLHPNEDDLLVVTDSDGE